MGLDFSKNQRLISGILLVMVSFFVSCKEETKTIKENGKNYYPLSVGSFYIYDIDSFLYDGINKRIDTSSQVIRDFVKEFLIDSAGNEVFRIERSVLVDSVYWNSYLSYTASIHSLSVQSFMHNSREVRLSFPITEFKTWDGNLYNNKPLEEYYYLDIQEPFIIGDSTYENTVTVLQKEFYEPKPPLQPLFDIYKKEVFAKDIGMIYKIDRDLDLQDDSGHEIIMNLKAFYIQK